MAKNRLPLNEKRLKRLKALREKLRKLMKKKELSEQNNKETKKEEANETMSKVRMTALARKTNPPKEAMDRMVKEFVSALNNSSLESSERGERWEKIWAIERLDWPYGMGGLLRTEIPEEFHQILDACITRSQNVAREFCQTQELTEEYLKNHTNKKHGKDLSE